MGHPWQIDCFVVIRKHPNVFADISANFYRPWSYYNALRHATEWGVLHKLLFGSDFPIATPQETMDALWPRQRRVDGRSLPPRAGGGARQDPAPGQPRAAGAGVARDGTIAGAADGRNRMLVGYVSDERYVAIADVAGRVRAGRARRVAVVALDAARRGSTPTSSRASTASRWSSDGFGSKSVDDDGRSGRAVPVPAARGRPARLRLAEVGAQRRAVRVPRPLGRAVPAQPLALRAGEGVRPHPRLVRRARPARGHADHPRRRLHPDRRRVEQASATAARTTPSSSPAPSAPGCTTSTPKTESGALLLVPLGRRAGAADRADRRARLDQHLERLQQLRRPQQLHQRRPACRRRRPSTPGSTCPATPRPAPSANGASPDEDYPPLSFDRPEPFNHIAGGRPRSPTRSRAASACHLAPAEWRLLGWLEREGFAYDLYAEHQLHDGTLDLDAYRVLIISVHPEYWSREMYRARQGRGSSSAAAGCMYLGGNGLNCEVEFLDDADAALPESPAGDRRAARHARPERPDALSGEPLPPHRRERGEPARRRHDRHRHHDRRAVPGGRRRPLGLRRHRAAERRPVRRGEPARALPRRRVRPRDRQDERLAAEKAVLLAKG